MAIDTSTRRNSASEIQMATAGVHREREQQPSRGADQI